MALPMFDPWDAVGDIFPVNVTSRDSAKKLAQQLSSIQASRTGIKALGGEDRPKSRPGFLASLFDYERSPLFAPARAVSAGAADILGLAQDTELSSYNPLESALRAGKGEFAVTGGDIFRTDDSDALLTRVAKLGGAFSWDVLTDPLSYVGGAGVFTRKGILAATLGDDALRVNLVSKLEREALKKKSAEEVSSLLDNLAARSRDVTVGTKLAVGPGNKIISRETAEVVDAGLRNSLAAKTIADEIADGFVTRGRAGIVKNLTNLFGDEELATTLFKSLDKELVGGLFLKNPITGRPIQRIAGGSGTGNAVTDLANQARFRLSASGGGRWGSRELSGRLGPTWATYKQGLLAPNKERLGVGRTLFTDYTGYKTHAAALKNNLSLRTQKQHAVFSLAVRARSQFPEVEQKAFNEKVKYFYFFGQGSEDLVDSDELTRMARAAASELRAAKNEAYEEFAELNIQIGYLPDHDPLMYSDEYIDWLMEFDPKQGPETRSRYRGTLRRVAFAAPPSDEDLMRVIGGGDVKLQQLKFAPAPDANKIANAGSPVYDRAGNIVNRFEEDPVKLLEKYTSWAIRTQETTRFVKSLEAAGIAMHIPPDLDYVVNLYSAVHMASAISKISQEQTKAIGERARQQKEKLMAMVSDETVALREAERAAFLRKGMDDYDAANDKVVVAVERLRELNRQIAELEPSLQKLRKLILDPNIRANYRSLDEARAAGFVEFFERAVRSAKSRLKRAAYNAEVNERILELTKARGKGEPISVWDPAQGKIVDIVERPASRKELKEVRDAFKESADKKRLLEAELDVEVGELRESRELIKDLRENITDWAEVLAVREMNNFAQLNTLLEERLQLENVIANELRPARRTAKANLDLLESDIAMPRAEGIRTATMTYVELRKRQVAEVARQRALKVRTVEDREVLAGMKEATKAARKDLQDLIASVNPTLAKSSTAGRRYLQAIIEMADTLSSEEIKATLAIMDSAKLDQFMKVLNDPNVLHEVRMKAVGDLMAVYKKVRSSGITEDMLRTLSSDEKSVFMGEKVYQAVGERYTAKRNQLIDDLRVLERSANPDQRRIEAIKRELDRIDTLTTEDGLRLIGANKVKVPESLENMYAPMGIRQALERMFQIEANPSEWETFIARVYDPLALVWKTAATVGRGPSYTLTNLVGALVNNWLGGVSARDHAVAAKILSVYNKAIERQLKETPDLAVATATDRALSEVRKQLGDTKIAGKPLYEIFTEFLESGVWLTTDVMAQAAQLRRAGLLTDPFILSQGPGITYDFGAEAITRSEKALQRSVNTLLTWRGQRFMNEINQTTEMFGRLAAFISGYERFGSKYSAVDNVMLLHFDYQDLSDAEQWFKRFVPFYTWTRNNVPLQIRASFLQQDKVRKLITLNENIKEAFGVDENDSWIAEMLPDYIDVNGGFASTFKFADNHIALFPKTPIQDIDKLFGMGSIFGIPVPVLRLREAAQSLGPAVSPLEFITQTNFDTGQKFQTPGESAIQIGRSLLPYVGTIQRVASAATVPATLAGADLSGVPFVESTKGMSNLYNFLVGAPFGASTITEKNLYGGMISQSKASSKQLQKLAAEANVDLKWLRKEIRKGTTLAELRVKIASGEGNLSRRTLETELKRLRGEEDDAPKQDYAKILSAFRAGSYGGF